MPLGGTIPEFSVADRLRKARELTGLTGQDFADEIGVSRRTVTTYERGVDRMPPKSLLLLWQLRTGVPAEWIRSGHYSGTDAARMPAVVKITRGKFVPRDESPAPVVLTETGDVYTPRDLNPEPTGLGLARPKANDRKARRHLSAVNA
jgi:transcriptional regulator with XRE-family HTH domain